MDGVIAQQIADANAEVDRLGDQYIQEFWDAAKEIFGPISYKEKSGLAWKALYQKEGFLDQVSNIRDKLVSDLNEIRRCLSEDHRKTNRLYDLLKTRFKEEGLLNLVRHSLLSSRVNPNSPVTRLKSEPSWLRSLICC